MRFTSNVSPSTIIADIYRNNLSIFSKFKFKRINNEFEYDILFKNNYKLNAFNLANNVKKKGYFKNVDSRGTFR